MISGTMLVGCRRAHGILGGLELVNTRWTVVMRISYCYMRLIVGIKGMTRSAYGILFVARLRC